ncbi:YjcB family protein [Shimwellia blattae]|uniref:Putative inner membrane protein n=1 Tax=Shimwellia blattae (strain ATCC 29907 / DSM 4481 / JCM 1650 / NBRC 105725 / CDC 9005-74) TaxID=630626 RepID=I2BDU2_SHIBC|nr:YjcB family protein [Shimwellia blattae]AFJ48696.1 putative inner membrane protein [Shimwellia blattae DSM 4481 = NBRC 105725]GAB81272.1 hypothetical protein YjcB [Shimwellia blattae DSM 4481 = NBRC 105725]VDY66185.1 Uncharacterised protein [Shimwellia blattae]VEC27247.1 Uncharacterised protein [Shimwellia blattae]
MAIVTTGVAATGLAIMRGPLISATLMFIASTLNIRLRKSDYHGLAVVVSGLGIVASCWFAAALLGITFDFPAIWAGTKSFMVQMMSYAPADYPATLP